MLEMKFQRHYMNMVLYSLFSLYSLTLHSFDADCCCVGKGSLPNQDDDHFVLLVCCRDDRCDQKTTASQCCDWLLRDPILIAYCHPFYPI